MMRHKRRHGYGPDLDPVGRYAGEDVLGRELRRLLKPSQRELLLAALGGVPLAELARRNGVYKDEVAQVLSHILERLRTSEHADQLLQELRDRHGPRHSPEVWRYAEKLSVHRCARIGCNAQPFPQAATGRTRLYCSDRCRVAAHRERKRAARERGADLQQNAHVPQSPDPKYRWQSYSDIQSELPTPRRLKLWYAEYLQHRLEGRSQEAVKSEAPNSLGLVRAEKFRSHLTWAATSERCRFRSLWHASRFRRSWSGESARPQLQAAFVNPDEFRTDKHLNYVWQQALEGCVYRCRTLAAMASTLTSPLHIRLPQQQTVWGPVEVPLPDLPAGEWPWTRAVDRQSGVELRRSSRPDGSNLARK
ncbi:hypothetical protein GCM10010357_55160 [Streptomyces luteireticuli]|uniref:HTH luxR-type domain-containing protein n=1 Tax=Streptomyces luteireticuli TaxID=173858 RepID=A0ABP3IVW9_9ACTN